MCFEFIHFFYCPQDNLAVNDVDRDKRGFGPDVGFGAKNAILGYVFGVS